MKRVSPTDSLSRASGGPIGLKVSMLELTALSLSSESRSDGISVDT